MATILRFTLAPLFFVWLNFLAVSLATQDDLVISTQHGKVQGKLVNGEVRAFLGVPYGKPPIGKLRFKAPQTVEKWNIVKDCTGFKQSCHQLPDSTYPGFKGAEMWNPNTPMSEDCLYLNVWSPPVNKAQSQPAPLAPVLVWIYGGGFFSGTSSLDIYDGRFLSKSEGVVVVSMNYRLGAFGFLSLPSNKHIKGNAGLLDQRLALEWVSKNIAAFGGDPSKVTLFGESAGSACVGFHLLSPGSQHLFHRAVMQSASPNAAWASTSRDVAWERSLKLASLLGCPTSHPAKLEICLQQADPQTIISEQYHVDKKPSLFSTFFVPHVDGDVLPDEVEVLLNSGKLPKKELMLGLTQDEGTFFLVYGAPGIDISSESLITRDQFLKGLNLSLYTTSEVIREAVIFQYTDWTDVTNRQKNRDALGKLVGDQIIMCPVLEFAQRYSQNGGKTFLYLFDHRSSVNPWPAWMGVMHGYEIEFVFGMPLSESLGYTKSEVNMTKKFMKHWANFARTGDPVIDGTSWPAFTKEHQEYVTLNNHQPQVKKMIRAKECHLWNKFLPQIRNISDELLSCVNAGGIILHCNYIILLVLLVMAIC
ncbi:unnamed protein product [Ophioblennius macclurei]